ncbi:MAG TPA: YdcF family protein [Clostridium sp.]|nr:YdcF family protein [Clostridium sp.]
MKRKIGTILLGIIIILYVILSNKVSNSKVVFSIPLTIFAVIIIIAAIIWDYMIEYIISKPALKVIYRCVKYGMIAISILLIAIEGIIICYPKKDISNSEYILVLGAGLYNGNLPTVTLRGRLDAAIECLDKNLNNSKIVVSGGQGKDEEIPEAEAMRNYLINSGVPEENILTEDKSANTNENFKYSKAIIENNSGKSIGNVNVKVVTTDFHTFRSRLLAKRNGYLNVTSYSSPTVWYLVPVNYIREGFAVVKSILFD